MPAPADSKTMNHPDRQEYDDTWDLWVAEADPTKKRALKRELHRLSSSMSSD